jgi:hypothetical protein
MNTFEILCSKGIIHNVAFGVFHVAHDYQLCIDDDDQHVITGLHFADSNTQVTLTLAGAESVVLDCISDLQVLVFELIDETSGYKILECGTVSQGRQSSNYEELLKTDKGVVLRVKIKRDTYDFQSSAVIQNFVDGKWCNLSSIPYSKMNVCEFSYLNCNSFHFAADRDALVKSALLILN